MEYWEFLLQKEGDQSWLPLDASQVEILEGRYRVMAHTSQRNTPVQIQIVQVLRDRARTLRRQGETNDAGLMVVMPFTRLGEGIWDILCRSNEAMGTTPGWQYAVQLRVVAHDADDDGDWFADEDRSPDTASAIWAEQAAQGQTSAPGEGGTGLDLGLAVAAMDAFAAQMAEADPQPQAYGLTLAHTALLGSEGQTLDLEAAITGPAEAANPSTLVVRLWDPQTAETAALTPVTLAAPTLPTRATLTLTVPSGLTTRLLLGEVGLFHRTEVVALQRFTVTVDVASLFDAIANQAETEAALDVVFAINDAAGEAAPPVGPNPDLRTWDLAGRTAPPREMPGFTLPRSSPDLPPKIYYPSPHEAAARQPSLPPTGQSRPLPSSPEAAPAPASPPGEPGRGPSLPPIAQPPRSEDPIAVLTGRSSGSVAKPRGPSPQLISHEAMGFKDLKLEDRFWTRLNDLAVSLQQEAANAPATSPVPMGEPPDPAAPPAPPPFAGEVVIYADEDPTLPPGVPASPAPPSDPITPPMPSLDLPEGDLVAGEPMVLTVRVPFHANRLYLKVWITDPQTRTLADEPRQLMNLMPNGQGQLQGNLQLTVPQGCLEAWFEAIAVDMVTQQESYKTTVVRSIVPPGQPPSPLDEFSL